MWPWLESLGVTLLAGMGSLVGLWLSKLRKPYWLIGYFIPLGCVLLYDLANHNPTLAVVPPISWLVVGRNKFVTLGISAAMLLTTLLSRLRRRRDRFAVFTLMIVTVSLMAVWPFLAPAFNQSYFSHLRTRIDSDGICLQSTDYTCGAAAAVTGLRKLGFPAEEGQIAVLSYTSSAIGTEPDILAKALQKRYGLDGLSAEFRAFKTVAELKNAGVVLAVIKFSFMVDHFVAVLEVHDHAIVVGDPLNGRTIMSYEEFARQWRFVGVTLQRK